VLGISIDVRPVKGQMLLFKFERQIIESMLLTRGKYLIPRIDGHLLAGSTLEYQDFDKSTTDDARQELLQSAVALLPELGNYRPVAQWAGLRPAAPEGLPYIGSLPPMENLYINAGQYRNGLVLAPASARLLADCLLHREPILDPSPYQPGNREPAYALALP
jgi:glycine oxidase